MSRAHPLAGSFVATKGVFLVCWFKCQRVQSQGMLNQFNAADVNYSSTLSDLWIGVPCSKDVAHLMRGWVTCHFYLASW